MSQEFHEYANFFPMMTDAEYSGLLQSIRENGLLEPIVIYNEKILDGRNRYRACMELGIAPRFEYLDEKTDPMQYVISKNLHRRHLNESQLGIIAVRLANMPRHRPDKKSALVQTSQTKAAKMVGVSTRLVASAAQIVKEASPKVIAEIEAGKITISQVARKLSRVKKMREITAKNEPLEGNGRRYSVICADPPWRYDFSQSASREIENQYQTMSLDDICALPVPEICTEDSILFLWATSPKLLEAIKVMEAWGFSYKTSMVWVKDKIGMGYYARQRHELLLIGSKGEIPTPEGPDRPDSVIEAPREEHSKKPDITYDLIEKMYPELERIELFARQQHPGWDVWGNEV